MKVYLKNLQNFIHFYGSEGQNSDFLVDDCLAKQPI